MTAAPLGRRVGAQARIELVLTLRRGESLLATFGIPLALLAFLAGVDLLPVEGTSRVDFLVPGVLTLAVISTGMVSLGIATAFERSYGVLKRLGASPLSRPGLLAAKTLAVVVVELAQFAALLALSLLLGWRAQGRPLLALAFVLLGTAAFAGLGLLMAGTLRAEATLGAANGLYIVLLFLGGIAFPLSRLPRGLAAVGRALPASALADCLRAALHAGAAVPGHAVAVLVVWAVVAPVAAALTFRWE